MRRRAVALSRLCSADLPEQSAFYDAKTGLGTKTRILLNGEESGAEGRAFAWIADGVAAGQTYELAALGNMSWENVLVSPHTGALNDSEDALIARMFAENARRLLDGEELANRIDRINFY